MDSRDVAEDLLHDAFVVVLSSIDRLRIPEELDAWMVVIVKNRAIDYLKEGLLSTYPYEYLDIEEVPERE